MATDPASAPEGLEGGYCIRDDPRYVPLEQLFAAQGAEVQTPQLPVQCSRCARLVDRDRLSVQPVGYEPVCSLCAADGEVEWAIRLCSGSIEREERVIGALRRAYEICSGR